MSKRAIPAWPFLIVVAVWFAWAFQAWLFPPRFGELASLEARAQWSDTFGALNTLFSAAAFIAVLLTLRSQEGHLTRQQSQIDRAEKVQQQQDFERTFYEILRLLREEREGLIFTPAVGPNPQIKPKTTRGRNAIRSAVRAFSEAAQRRLDVSACKKEEAVKLYLLCVHNRYESSLGPYFRLNYTMLFRIRTEASLSESERLMYGNLFRSQLTSYEVILFGLNGLAPFSKDFSQLLTEFRIMKYAKNDRALTLLKRFYPPEAFEARSDEGEG